MEAVSLAIAFPGFINDGIELGHRFQAARSFRTEADQARILLKSNLTRIHIWEEKAGVKDGELTDGHDPALNDPDVLSNVRGHLKTAKELGSKIEKALTRLSPETSNAPTARSRLPFPSRSGIKWGFGHDKTILDDLQKFDKHTEKLYQLVTPKLGKGCEDSKISDELKAMQSQFTGEFSRIQRQEINEWIQADMIDQQFDIHRDARLEGTGDWIFSHPAYQAWVSDAGDPKSLWLCGPAGSGKTVLSATIIQSLRDTSLQGPPVVYCFCLVYAQAETQLQGIIRTFISQFARQSVHMREQIWEYMHSSTCDGGNIASQSDLWTILKGLLEGTSGCTLVIDGLDEFEGSNRARSRFLRQIKSTVKNTSTKVMVASRDEGDIRDELFHAHVCKISRDLVRADIRQLAQALVFERLPRKKEELKHELSERLTDKSDGMFLWIKQQNLLLLRGSKTDSQLRQIVDKMPSGLTGTYMRNWREITNQAEDDYIRTLRMLRWAAFSFRPLTVAEITEAVMVHPESSGISQEEWPDEINEEYIQEEIKGLCGSLVNIQTSPGDPGSSTVHLAHASVKEFLLTMLDVTLQDHHAELAQICLRYMNFTQIWKRDGSRIPYTFLDYAIRMWHKHSKAAMQQDSKTLELINSLLDPKSSTFSNMRNYLIETGTKISTDAKAERKNQPGNPLWFAAGWNMVEATKHLLSTHPELLDEMEPGSGTPLLRACARGYTNLANFLLDNNADVEFEIEGYGPALKEATIGGHLDLVASLVDRGLDMELKDSLGRTAFLTACEWNRTEVALVLLGRGANQAVICNKNSTPLFWACYHGNKDLVTRILDASRDLITPPAKNGSPLHLASCKGHTAIAILLLDYGAEVNYADSDGNTPLHSAAFHGHVEMSELLSSRGADLNALNAQHETPLLRAVANSHFGFAEKLLELGADANTPDSNGWPPLQFAVNSNSPKMVNILLSHGAKVNEKTNDGFNALHHAVSKGFSQVAKDLLLRDADVVGEDANKWTPLHYAAQKNYKDLARMLLQHGAAIDARTASALTSLHIASGRGCLEVAEYLMACGANATMEGPEKRTPLHYAAQCDYPKLIPLLLSHGANIYAQTSERKYTPLYVAVFKRNYGAAQALCKHGDTLQFSMTTGFGLSPLQYAALNGLAGFVELLMENGADPTFGGLVSTTPLYLAAKWGEEEIVRNLVHSQVDFNALCGSNYSPFNGAAFEGHITILEILAREQKIASLGPDCEGRSALHLAARGGHVPTLNFLLEAGLDPTLRDARNRTVLHYAAASSSIEMVESVLQLPCISSILSETRGWSVLHWAAIAGSCQLVQLLISAGLLETCITADLPGIQPFWTPWSIAQFFNNQDLLSDADCPLRLRDESAEISPGTRSKTYVCDSCESRIFGPRYFCSTCDYMIDYCFMCMMDVEKVHPGHKLEQAES